MIRGVKGYLTEVLGRDNVWDRPKWREIGSHAFQLRWLIREHPRQKEQVQLFEEETSMLYLRQRKVTSELFRVRRKMIEGQKSDLLRTCKFRFWYHYSGRTLMRNDVTWFQHWDDAYGFGVTLECRKQEWKCWEKLCISVMLMKDAHDLHSGFTSRAWKSDRTHYRVNLGYGVESRRM